MAFLELTNQEAKDNGFTGGQEDYRINQSNGFVEPTLGWTHDGNVDADDGSFFSHIYKTGNPNYTLSVLFVKKELVALPSYATTGQSEYSAYKLCKYVP